MSTEIFERGHIPTRAILHADPNFRGIDQYGSYGGDWPQSDLQYAPALQLPGLTQPLRVDPTAIAENVYASAAGTPDTISQQRLADYAVSRHLPQTQKIGRIEEIIDGETRTSFAEYRGQLFNWKSVMKVTGAALLGVNVVINAPAVFHDAKTAVEDLGDEINQIKYDFSHDETKPQTITVPSKNVTITLKSSLPATTPNEVGKATVSQKTVRSLADQVSETLGDHPGAKIVSINLKGNASAEWATNASLTKADEENVKLAQKRAASYSNPIEAALDAKKIEHPEATVTQVTEHNLTTKENNTLQQLAKKQSFESGKQAIEARDAGELKPGKLRSFIDKHITGKRGSTVEVQIDVPTLHRTKPISETVFIEDHFNNPDRDYDGLKLALWPALLGLAALIPKVGFGKRIVPKKRRIYVEDEIGDPTWLRFYNEAITEDGNLKRHPFWFTRKGTLLLREDRIKAVDTMQYYGMDGAERTVRTHYIDHKPSEKTLAEFRKINEIVANANMGHVADVISEILIYPSKNVGINPRAAKQKVGLGVDEQYDHDTLGLATPLLETVEIQMPENPSEEELQSFYGALRTMIHEYAGHGTHIKPFQYRKEGNLRRTADGSYVSYNAWRPNGRDLYARLRQLPRRSRKPALQFDITRQVVDINGETHLLHDRVDSDDPRLGEAIESRIAGAQVTEYAGTNYLEQFAETASAEIHPRPMPYRAAGVHTTSPANGSYMQGYRADKEASEMYFDATGLDTENLDRVHTGEVVHTLSTIEQEKTMHAIAEWARNTEVPEVSNMTRILGYVINGSTKKRHILPLRRK